MHGTTIVTIRVPRGTKTFAYSSEPEPVVVVRPGERVEVETASAVSEFDLATGTDLNDLVAELCDPLAGPIALEGAEPGDVLQVHIDDIRVVGRGTQGVIPGIGILEWPRPLLAFLELREDEVMFAGELRLRTRPNIGCMGVAPAGGPLPSVTQGDHGGNLDTRFLCAGSVVEFPVFHPGGLLFLGDCHQLQGDGALGGMPPETDAVVTLRCTLRCDGFPVLRPRILTSDRIMFLASAATLEEAAAIATRDVIGALVAEKGLDEDTAYLLMTVKADLEVCQVVNTLCTVRVCLDRSLYEGLPATPGNPLVA